MNEQTNKQVNKSCFSCVHSNFDFLLLLFLVQFKLNENVKYPIEYNVCDSKCNSDQATAIFAN